MGFHAIEMFDYHMVKDKQRFCPLTKVTVNKMTEMKS